MADQTERFNIGDAVPQTGWYLCIPCGYMQEFTEGDQFTPCDACQAGTSLGPDGFQEDEEDFWELVRT